MFWLMNKLFLCTMLILTLQVAKVKAQTDIIPPKGTQGPYSVIKTETYNRVLDILFPRDDLNASQTVFSFILRFYPHALPESQIIIRRRTEGVEVTEYTSLDGSIYAQLNKMLAHTGKEDPVEMAKAIKIKEMSVQVPYIQIQRWYKTFFKSLGKTTNALKERGLEFDRTGGSETVFLHGGFYNLWYEQRLNKMSVGLYDIDSTYKGSGAEFALVHWMNMVRRNVQNIKQP